MGEVVKMYTEEEYAALVKEEQKKLAGDENFAAMATTHAKKVSREEFSRKEVVHAFVRAFELIGGVPRMALWANDNPTEFYKLFARMLPSQASSVLGETNEMTIRHVIPRSKLDD